MPRFQQNRRKNMKWRKIPFTKRKNKHKGVNLKKHLAKLHIGPWDVPKTIPNFGMEDRERFLTGTMLMWIRLKQSTHHNTSKSASPHPWAHLAHHHIVPETGHLSQTPPGNAHRQYKTTPNKTNKTRQRTNFHWVGWRFRWPENPHPLRPLGSAEK